MSVTLLREDGSIQRKSITITGAVDGENVTISGSGFLGMESFTLSGTLNGNKLALTGAQSTPLVFNKASLSDFQADESALDSRSQSIVSAKLDAQTRMRAFQNQRNFVTAIDQLIGKLERFEMQADVHLARFPNGEKSYGAITDRVRAYVARERQLSGNLNASVARSRLSVAATQASLQTDQIHSGAEQLQAAFDSAIKPLMSESQNLERQCHAIPPNAPFTPEEIQSINGACGRLENAIPPFQDKFKAMRDGLSHLEQVYQREHNAQEQLLQESSRLD
jgi:ribosome-associated translation inhibitor RaiA